MKKQLIERLLGDTLLEVMIVVWENYKGEPMTALDLLSIYNTKWIDRNWSLSVLMSTLNTLENRGYIISNKISRSKFFAPTMSDSEYITRLYSGFLDSLPSSSVSDVIASLYQQNKINDEEINKIIEKTISHK